MPSLRDPERSDQCADPVRPTGPIRRRSQTTPSRTISSHGCPRWTAREFERRGDRLAGVDQAITVRKRSGKVLKTNGPFAETKEWIAGYDVIECASLDEAIGVAAKHPMARFGKIEIRPFWRTD